MFTFLFVLIAILAVATVAVYVKDGTAEVEFRNGDTCGICGYPLSRCTCWDEVTPAPLCSICGFAVGLCECPERIESAGDIECPDCDYPISNCQCATIKFYSCPICGNYDCQSNCENAAMDVLDESVSETDLLPFEDGPRWKECVDCQAPFRAIGPADTQCNTCIGKDLSTFAESESTF